MPDSDDRIDRYRFFEIVDRDCESFSSDQSPLNVSFPVYQGKLVKGYGEFELKSRKAYASGSFVGSVKEKEFGKSVGSRKRNRCRKNLFSGYVLGVDETPNMDAANLTDVFLVRYSKGRSMSIDWMHSLILFSFVALWALIGQFSIARP